MLAAMTAAPLRGFLVLYIHRVSKKRTTFDALEWIFIFFGRNVADGVGNQKMLYVELNGGVCTGMTLSMRQGGAAVQVAGRGAEQPRAGNAAVNRRECSPTPDTDRRRHRVSSVV